MLLGWRALYEIRTRPGFTGRRMAWTGIGLGLAFITIWLILGAWWNRHARQPMLNGPIVELRAGLSGDVAGFTQGFIGGQHEEAMGFLSALANRFGALQSMAQRSDHGLAATSPPELVIPYLMDFEAGPVEAEAAFLIQDQTGQLTLQWVWLAVRDPTEGDLVYPASMGEAAQAVREPHEAEPQ
jgi:hypothetical protein